MPENEEQLARLEESIRMLLESVQDYAIYMLDPEGRISTWNEGVYRMLGYSADQIVGQHFSRFYAPEDVARGRPAEELQQAAEKGRTESEGWRVRKDGFRFWANVITVAFRDESGTLTHFARITRDFSERRKLTFLGDVSVLLSESLDYVTNVSKVVQLTVPFLADGCVAFVREGPRLKQLAVAHIDPAKVAISKEIERRFPLDPVLKSGPWEVIRTGKPELYSEINDQNLARVSSDTEYVDLLRKLQMKSVLVMPLTARSRTFGALVFIHDESNRKYGVEDIALTQELANRCAQAIDNARAHTQLEGEREFLDAVVRQMSAGVLIVEAPSGKVVLANPEANRIFGQIAIGESFGTYTRLIRRHPNDEPYLEGETLLARSLLNGEIITEEEAHRDTPKGRMVIAISSTPIRDRSGHIVAAVAILQDITTRKHAQEETLREAAFRERFIGILSHDLRSPLAAISVAAQVLLRQNLPEGATKVAAKISSGAQRMSRMIGELLDLTRSRLGGGIPVAPKTMDLREICRLVVEELELAHTECELHFEAEHSVWGQWDPDRIAQVASNLIGNAVEYGSETGPIHVAVGENQMGAWMEVTNSGPPIPEEMLPNLFDPFLRGAQPSNRLVSSGLGLGLFIAHQIVLAHGGTIEVDSSKERGTRFTVRLPRANAEATLHS